MRRKMILGFKMTACADLVILTYFSYFEHHCGYFPYFFYAHFLAYRINAQLKTFLDHRKLILMLSEE